MKYQTIAALLHRRSPRRWRRRELVALLSCLVVGIGSLFFGAGHLSASAAAPEWEWTGAEDIRINDPGELPPSGQNGEEAPNCNIQSEVSVARWGDQVVAGWNDGSQCVKNLRRRAGLATSEGLSLSGYGYSSDGGQTWTDGGFLPTPSGGGLFGDPVLAAGPGGIFYYATLLEDTARRIGVARSMDGGRTWSVPVIASGDLPTTPPPSSPLAARTAEDKPWIAVDTTSSAYRGNLYVAWTEIGGQPGLRDDAVYFSRSLDQGLSFSVPRKLSVPVLSFGVVQERPGIGTQVAVGPEGQVYVAWVHPVSYAIWMTRSFDGGVSFTEPRRIAEVFPVGHRQEACGTTVLEGDIRIFNWIAMAVDTSGSSDPASADYNPNRGTIYLAAAHDASGHPQDFEDRLLFPGDESDIAWTYSRDGGLTWANLDEEENEIRVIINSDQTPTDQFHPAIAVDSRGRVAVSWYDRSVSETNWEMTLATRISSDGGETFGPTLQVGDDPFPPSRTNPNTGGFSACYMGEYNGLIGGDDEFLLAWGDNRDGNDLHPDPNVYFDRISFPSAQPAEAAQGGSLTEQAGQAASEGETADQPPSSPLHAEAPSALAKPVLCDRRGSNQIIGGGRGDILIGTSSADVLCGWDGNDVLRGVGGDDVVIGGSGRDLLVGGGGTDICSGGAGRDRTRTCEARRLGPR